MKKLTLILVIAALLSGCASEERRADERSLKLQHELEYERRYGHAPPEEPSTFWRIIEAVGAIKGAQTPRASCTSNQLGNTVYTNCR